MKGGKKTVEKDKAKTEKTCPVCGINKISPEEDKCFFCKVKAENGASIISA